MFKDLDGNPNPQNLGVAKRRRREKTDFLKSDLNFDAEFRKRNFFLPKTPCDAEILRNWVPIKVLECLAKYKASSKNIVEAVFRRSTHVLPQKSVFLARLASEFIQLLLIIKFVVSNIIDDIFPLFP